MKIKSIYQKHIGRKFFLKNMLIFTTISIVPIILLSFFITTHISSVIQKKELKYNDLVLYNINEYFNQKYNLTHNIILQIYKDGYSQLSTSYYLENSIDKNDMNYPSYKNLFIQYYLSLFSRDNDLESVNIYKKLDKVSYQLSRDYFEDDIPLNEIKDDYGILKHLNDVTSKISIYPAHLESKSKKMVYTVSSNIKELYSASSIGLLMLNFSCDAIDSVLAAYGKDSIEGTIYILTKNGDVIYDSSRKYYGKKYPYIDVLRKGVSATKINGAKYMINSYSENKSGVIVAGVIPKKMILKDINTTNRIILIVTILCLVIITIFTRISTNILFKRMKVIYQAMKSVRTGTLSTRIDVGNTNDEIADISISFNQMCDKLEEYINKVYLSDIRQKNAELSALQAQINPHFLFNTLEAIHMKLIVTEDREAGNMICNLANMFRSMMEQNTIVRISDEIEYSKAYLELFKIRYGDKLDFEFNIDHEILQYSTIKHILQPVVENYIIHGYDLRKANNKISITGNIVDNDIYISVEDNGLGISKEKLNSIKENMQNFNITSKSGIGLSNVHERIKLMYGSPYGIEIESTEDANTRITIKIGSKKQEELLNNVQGINRR